MKANAGVIDRIIRIIVGLALLGYGYTHSAAWGLIGIVPLATAFMGFCPVYSILGVCTIPKK